MPRGETLRHRRLKELALAWARARGWGWAAEEVRVPRSGYRADVVAGADGEGGEVAVFECKQSRADLRKDAHAEAEVAARVAELETRRRELEALLVVHRPEARCGEALWAEFDRWDFGALGHRTHTRVVDELMRWRRRRREGTKFSRMHRWGCADRLYLVVEENLHAPAEIPAGWGVLVHRGGALELDREAPALAPGPAQRAALRRAIEAKRPGPRRPPAGPDLLFPESG